MKNIDVQYIDACNEILQDGVFIENERTGVRCKTLINFDFTYGENNVLPILTTKKCFWKSAIAEVLGYIRGYTNASDFRKLGTKTWDANANLNESWLNNPHRKGEDDLGRVYGFQGRNWQKPNIYFDENLQSVDQLKKLIDNLSKGIDDRGEILTYWNPGEFEYGCLRPCMHSYQFSLLDGYLYCNITQRSGDIPLGELMPL